MSITVNTRVYNADSNVTPNNTHYAGPANTFAAKDILALRRTPPKPSGLSKGVARSGYKFYRTVVIDTVTGATAEASVDCVFNIPVGMSLTDVQLLIDDSEKFSALSTAEDLVYRHDINH